MNTNAHSVRPKGLRKGNSWVCKCRTINVWESEKCKAILVEKVRRERQLSRYQKSYRKQLTENTSPQSDDFWDFFKEDIRAKS
jgi:hypothetical protein